MCLTAGHERRGVSAVKVLRLKVLRFSIDNSQMVNKEESAAVVLIHKAVLHKVI